MTFKQFGLDGHRALIEHDLMLADYLARQVTAAPELELLARGLSVVSFRLAPPALLESQGH